MLFRLLILMLSFLSLVAGDYLWPAKAKPYLSATFCEYRDGHFHAGLDVKTWGEMGVPCQAIAAGYVERISAGYWGYGKVLFLKLDDGRRAVYAHLDYFTPALEKILRSSQLTSRRYAADIRFEPNQIRVKSGDVLAYTGVSGTRFPHLHFEIRDTANTPINPMQFYRQIIDTESPVLNFLAFVPLSEHSTINGSQRPWFIDLSSQNKHRYVVDQPIHASGTFGIEFNSYDVANSTLNKYAIYKARFYIEDSLVIEMTYDQIPFETAKMVEAHRPLYAEYTDWRFTRLYQNGDLEDLVFYLPGRDGHLKLPPGEHHWRLVLEDYQGNQTTVQGTTLNRLPVHSTWHSTKKDSALYRVSRRGDMHHPIQIKFQDQRGARVAPRTTFYTTTNTAWEFKFPRGINAGLLAIVDSDDYSPEKVNLIQPRHQSPPTLTYEWVRTPLGKLVRLLADEPWAFPAFIELAGPQDTLQLPLRIVSETVAETQIITPREALQYDHFSMTITPDTLVRYDFQRWHTLMAGDSVALELLDGTLSVRLRVDSIAGTAHFIVDTVATEIDGVIWPGFRITQPESSTPASGNFQFYVGEGTADTWHLYKRRGRRLTILDNNTSGPWLQGKISGSGEYLLLADTTPPALTPLLTTNILSPGNKLLFKVTDNLPERAAAVRIQNATLNEEPIFPDYNPLRQELSYWLLPDTPTGKYTLKITMADQAGNRSENRYQFRVR